MKITRIVNLILAALGVGILLIPSIPLELWRWWVTMAITLLCLEHGIEELR